MKAYRVDPRYTTGLDHDSAVLTLDRPLSQKPVRVARQGTRRCTATATLLGFGRTGSDGPGTHLKQAVLTLAPPASCDPYTSPGDSPLLKVCGLPRTGTTDSVCKGDSGGPLVVGGVLIGVVSTGNKYCDTQHPVSVFTRATDVPAELLSW
ncbi:trypsin-like serine protease [Kitasatospora sp. NPDC097691]|uniref:trypsin-like serine protease n=1 Tax=Kitasatospora sp. NPDC097691 TaxID=3157231 RepID=UPI00332D6FBC